MPWPNESAFAFTVAATLCVSWAESSSNGSPAANLRMLLFLAATVVLPAAASGGGRRRSLCIAAHRLAAFLLLPEQLLALSQLRFSPWYWTVDAFRLFLGEGSRRRRWCGPTE